MIAWLDVETTGLDPAEGHLLEVGIILTDNALVEQHRAQVVIAPPSGAVVRMDATVKAMHEDNGLWAEARMLGVPLYRADIALSEWLRKHCEEPPVMAGSTVGFDRKWIEAKLPRLAREFHYRSIDVSSLKELNRRLKFAGEWSSARKTHRALDDIEDSIRELRWYLSELGLLPTRTRLFGLPVNQDETQPDGLITIRRDGKILATVIAPPAPDSEPRCGIIFGDEDFIGSIGEGFGWGFFPHLERMLRECRARHEEPDEIHVGTGDPRRMTFAP